MTKSELIQVLAGQWRNTSSDSGWNMIAVPANSGNLNYKLLVNAYTEELVFTPMDDKVVNKGLQGPGKVVQEYITPIGFSQKIIENPSNPTTSSVHNNPNILHEELGVLQLIMPAQDEQALTNINVSKSVTTARGNVLFNEGSIFVETNKYPRIPSISGIPDGGPPDLNLRHKYLRPYREASSRIFDVFRPNDTLQNAHRSYFHSRNNPSEVITLHFHAIGNSFLSGSFLQKHAPVTEFIKTIWIYKFGNNSVPIYNMQYSQTVILEFNPRQDGQPGLIRWPHVSVNTLTK